MWHASSCGNSVWNPNRRCIPNSRCEQPCSSAVHLKSDRSGQMLIQGVNAPQCSQNLSLYFFSAPQSQIALCGCNSCSWFLTDYAHWYYSGCLPSCPRLKVLLNCHKMFYPFKVLTQFVATRFSSDKHFHIKDDWKHRFFFFHSRLKFLTFHMWKEKIQPVIV